MSKTDAGRLERIQSRFHRLMCGKACDQNCMPALEERRQILSLRFLKSAMSPLRIFHDLLPSQSETGRFILPHRRTKRRSDSFFIYACELFNQNFKR